MTSNWPRRFVEGYSEMQCATFRATVCSSRWREPIRILHPLNLAFNWQTSKFAKLNLFYLILFWNKLWETKSSVWDKGVLNLTTFSHPTRQFLSNSIWIPCRIMLINSECHILRSCWHCYPSSSGAEGLGGIEMAAQQAESHHPWWWEEVGAGDVRGGGDERRWVLGSVTMVTGMGCTHG